MRRLPLERPTPEAPDRHQDRPAIFAIAVTVLWLLGLVVLTLIPHLTSHATPAPAPAPATPATSPGVVILPTPDTTAPAGASVDPAATYIPIPAGPPISTTTISEHTDMLPLAAVTWPWAHLPHWQMFMLHLMVALAGVAVICVLTSSDRAKAAVQRHWFATSVFILAGIAGLVRMIWVGGLHLVLRAAGLGVLFCVATPTFYFLLTLVMAVVDWLVARRRRRAYAAYQAHLMRLGGGR